MRILVSAVPTTTHPSFTPLLGSIFPLSSSRNG
jgi:hypothetical protein